MMMISNDEADAERREPVPLVLPLDPETVRWLAELARGSDQRAGEIVASMLKMIRVDDEAASRQLH